MQTSRAVLEGSSTSSMPVNSTPPPGHGSMFLVLPVPFRQRGGQLLFESQACNGLKRWADNFGHVVMAAPVMPEQLAQADKTIFWEDTEVALDQRITCIQLPWAYRPGVFVREYRRIRRLFAEEIGRCEYLQFVIGGLVGDWGAVAAKEAAKQGRPFAIHTDRVESDVLRKLAKKQKGWRASKMVLDAWLMDRYHHSIIRRCSAGLWHGQECYTAYSPWCGNNHLIHDVHTKASDAISEVELQTKLSELVETPELKIVYAGRMAEMKAPLEWVKAIAHARDRGVALQATWYGDGELRARMEAEIAALKLNGSVHLAGFVSDRTVVLRALREAHLMLFTHITPESPRCLLEALISGTAIVGYDNPFARDLTPAHGGGSYLRIYGWQALAKDWPS